MSCEGSKFFDQECLSALRFSHQMAQFRQDYLVHRQLDGGRRPWHGEHEDVAHQTTDRAAEQGCRADLLITEHSKQLAVPGNGLLSRLLTVS